ncbi:DUF1361 domain-containing protein [Algibacter marinivivus]|uniref:DUF1361 domain-containing protein n=1 Tax=Algibacter marinivivus TaxID=2100723 RepID=A0A2U2X1Y6_9FLAO|nr:DUF1361 domain-containing protein [Algibacter marinivivus]PWH81791.1 DUF1361 domain-containing protein [Algibacter marinivivus]
MDFIKKLFLSRFKTFTLVSVSILFSIILLMIRMKLTHNFFYLFLVWNLFLAVIPFAISTYLVSLPKLNKLWLVLCFGVWLLFLPNAPYIITDLLHLKISPTHLLWLDILVVMSFALNGLLLFYLSIIDMKSILQTFLSKKKVNYLITTILFLTGFGVYLGRFLRYNSWGILSNPKYLFVDIINIVIKPFANQEAWLFTILFGLFLMLGNWIFTTLRN